MGCLLMNSDCKTPYNEGEDAPVGLDETKTFLTYKNDVPEGYKKQLCMVCTNGA